MASGFGGGVSPVKQQGSVTPGGVAVWYDEGILVDGSAPGGLVTDAPLTGGPFARQGGAWIPITGGGAGTLTSITAGTGLTGGTITTSGMIALATPVSLANGGTGVSAGSATAALTALGGAPLNSAALTGTPTLVTPPAGTDSSNALATTAWVTSKIASATAGVSQITATTPLNASAATGNVALTLATVPVASGGTGATTAAAGLAALGGAPLLSPPLTGIPTAPTAAVGTDTTQVATTAFVKAAVDAIDALPTGGAIYDVLSKASATSGDVEWRGAGVRPNNNTVIGTGAFNSTTVQVQSTAVGAGALAAATTGLGRNAAYGFNALAANTSGNQNVAVGFSAFSANTNGSFNAVVGSGALISYSGNGNSILGFNVFPWLTTGEINIAIGQNAGTYFGTGSGNADRLLTATRCIYIGAEVRSIADNSTNEIVIGSRGAAIPIIGHGSNTITLGNADITALYTQGTIYVDGKKIGGFAPSIAWTANTDPDGASFFVNNTERVLNIKAIAWIVEEENGSAAEVTIVKAATGTPISGGTPIHGVPLDADDLAGQIQDITPTLSMTLEIGERLGLRATAPAPGWVDSVASITVYLEP